MEGGGGVLKILRGSPEILGTCAGGGGGTLEK